MVLVGYGTWRRCGGRLPRGAGGVAPQHRSAPAALTLFVGSASKERGRGLGASSILDRVGGMLPAQEEADRTVFVGNLEARVREEILYELFLQAGPLTKVTICKDREGKPKSFGFVCFKHPESVSYAIALLNGIRLYGRPINVQYRFGSSRSCEPANQSFESCVKINSHSYRNEEAMGRSSFSMQFSPINNASLSQEYFLFQKMVNMCGFFPQQWPTYYPALQLPYYEMTAPLPNSTSASSSLNHVSDLEAGPSSYEWTQQQPSDSDLYQTNKRKRQKQSSDSDSSTENSRGNEYSPKFQKCKKKRY